MVKNYHVSTCTATGKRGFATRADARRSRRDSHFRDVAVYTCDECGLFHVGGWHGLKDRAAHRREHETMTVEQAAKELNVTTGFIRRLITTNKIRHNNGHPHTTDIQQLTKQ